MTAEYPKAEVARFRKHCGVRAAFNRKIVKGGRVSRVHGELYNRLFRDRQKGDYVSFAEFNPEYVEMLLQGSEAFLADVRPMLKSFGARTQTKD